MATLSHAELWSTWAYGGGTRLGLLLGLGDGEATRAIGAERRLTVEVAVGEADAASGTEARALADAYALVRPGRVLRLCYRDGTWQEWWISEVEDASGSPTAKLTCLGLSGAIAKCPAIALTDSDGRATLRFDAVELTPQQHLDTYIRDALDAGGLTFVDFGTVTPTGKVTLPYDATDPWRALQLLAEATACELDVTRDDGTSQYKVHIVPQVGAGTGPRLRFGVNAAFRRTRSALSQVTRVTGVGADGATIGEAVWIVASVSGTTIGLADPAGGDGPIAFDDQLNGLYLEAQNRTTRTQITDSSASGQTVVVASATGFAVGDRVRVRATSTGERLTALEDPAAVAAFGVLAATVRRDDLPPTANLIPNADQATWTGPSSDPANGWQKVGTPTVTRTTTAAHVLTGAYSARVQTTTDGHGYATPSFPILPTTEQPYGSGFLQFKLVSGQVRVELVVTDGVTTWILPDGVRQKAVTKETGRFVSAGVSGIDLKELGVTSGRLRVVQEGAGAAEFYVDSAQATESGGQQPYVTGAGPTALWQACNARLLVASEGGIAYQVDAVDFYRADAANYPYHQFVLGATHALEDPVLGIVDGTRVLSLTERLWDQLATKLTLSSRPEDRLALQARRPVTRLAPEGFDFLGAGEARVVTDGQVSAGTTTFVSTAAGFTTAHIGRTLWVFGAGVDGAILKTRITARTSPTQVTMANAAAVTTTGLTAIVGAADAVATLAAAIGGQRAGSVVVNEAGKLAANANSSSGQVVDRLFEKPNSSDPDTFDSVTDGSTYLKVLPFLTIVADQDSVTDTAVIVDITVADPTGGAAPSISHNGGGAVTGSNPYTIARPTAGDGPRLVTFTASKTGRISQSVTVVAPEQVDAGSTPITVVQSLEAGAADTTNDDIDITWSVANPPAGGSYDLVIDCSLKDATGFPITKASVTSPYTWDAAADGVLFDPKGTLGAELMTLLFTLKVKNSSSAVVAQATVVAYAYGEYIP